MEEDEWDDALLSEIAALETRHLQSHRRQNAPAAAWSCRSCTLQNEASMAACQVCGTPRGQTFQAQPPPPRTAENPAAAARKTVQARLSFDGTVASQPRQPQEPQDVGRSEPSPFAAREQPLRSSQQTTLTPAATGSGLVLTSRRSSGATASAAATGTAASLSPPVQIQTPRHAAGEDAQAKTRYLDVVARSNFPQIDYEAAQHFVYPTNYSIRDYQLTIAEKALYHNTLVSLPTGLGKTLVAAVVMYNFYRWFPTGKIVFMAPTKPLVAQQIKACHEIMGIPLSDTAELQGNVPPTMRRVLWNSRRVFFCTPQSLQNDLRRGVCAAEKFVCIVVDEAHRATGNYAYCCVVQEIEAKTPFFRILALSATPGAKFDIIQDVVANLRISHIESRSADDPDVKKYTHARQEEVIVCRLGAQIVEVKTLFFKCFTPIIQRLLRGNIIPYGDPEKLSSWHVLQAREKFRKSPSYASNRSAESDLALLVSLLHAKSLLIGHGLTSFREQILNWTEERKKGKMSWSKREMLQSSEFQSLELSLGVTEDASSSTNTASHPKLVKLREVLLEHFQRHAAAGSSTRAIVFTQYRASVSEIVSLLRPLAPLLNVQPFIGQGSSGKAKENKGQTQKVQQEIVRRFRLGEFNVLVATCIAEEGLDIGEVDLIVSFDALTSPVRMIQRMGRTGRKRVGRVIILVTEGDEQKKLKRSASAAKTVSRALTTYKSKFKYSKCPRMLPTGICPALKELEMNIPTFHASQVGGKAASVQVDPDLWQLSDAERAIALMKYFPPNYALSSRNKLFPVVASRKHLLRRQPRCLGRKGVGSRVGYSSRSLILQRVVRKINGLEEVMESDSDDDGKSDDAESKAASADSNNGTEPDSTKDSSKRLRRSSVATNDDAGTDSDMGSPWRETNTPNGVDIGSKHDESFGAMDESVNGIDMHFSPQFVDSATQFAPVVEEIEQPKESSKRQQDGEASAHTAKKQKVDSSKEEGLPQEACSLNEAVFTSGVIVTDDTEEAQPAGDVPIVLDGQDITEHPEAEENTQQMSATLSLTLTSDSPRPSHASKNVCQDAPVNVSDVSRAAQQPLKAPRLRSTRQLQFHEDDVRGDESNQTPSDGQKLPAPERDEPSGQDATEQVDDGDPPAFSFALLPPQLSSPGVGNREESGSDNDDQAEEPSAFSFALLPPLSTTKDATPNKPCTSQSPAVAAPQEGGSQPVEDGTDGDEVDESNETKAPIKKELAEQLSQDAIIVDLTEKKDCCTIVEEKVQPENATASTNSQEAASVVASQRPTQKSTEPEQEEEGCCSVCLESESYDDDPIVFCDGCNLAVHQFCYGIRVVPSDKWFCDVCTEARADVKKMSEIRPRCQLCPHHGGAFKRTGCGKWVHVQCFLWIPEFRVEQGEDDMLGFGALNSLDPDRATLDCSLCHSKQGKGIIQCAHKRCLTAFHVSCAAYAHYRMDQLDPPGEEDGGTGTLFLAYCSLHRNSTAPINPPEHQKTPPALRFRSPKPPLPNSATKMTSPSHLLASPSSAEAKRKVKSFRRLKRKYDASQSQMFSQPGTKASPASTSPWQKRIRRSKRRRETSRVLAAAYIDDTADVRGGAKDEDDEEDDYGDDYKDAADDSFINDSSQLLYSQSVVSPEVTGDNSAKKKKRKKHSPDMRAIYARSLFESQNSPLLLRRGGRQLGALPSNGIIRACLEELHNESSEIETTPSPRPRSRSRVPTTSESTAAIRPGLSAPFSASATVTESDEDDSATEAEPSPSFNLLVGAPLQSIQENAEDADAGEKNDGELVDSEMAPPSFSLLGASRSHPRAASATSTKSSLPSSDPGVPAPASLQPLHGARNTSEDEVHMKIEANRLKALKKLEERRQTKLLQAQGHSPQQPAAPAKSFKPASTSHGASDHGFTSAATLTSTETHEDETATPSFSLLGSTSGGQAPPPPAVHLAVAPTVDLTRQKPTKPGPSQPKWIIFTSSAFARSSGFPTFLSEKHGECTVAIDDSLEADALLSVRTAVAFLTVQQLQKLALSAPTQNVVKSRRIGMLLAMHKKIIVAVVHDGSDSPEMQRLRQLPSVTVVVQPRIESLCAQLHQLAHQELVEGFELPSPSQCRPDCSGGIAKGLDADFASRLQFFRTIPALSLGSALSLSFRFKNFAAGQVPVLKFNEMHWRRMLPWISELTAEEIQEHVQQNVERR
ncbi:Fanconi anemia group M protein [Phytophthora rubi]|uniref:Fanconi anemia group M protein n=1 Tax=Phytophthora rubi TaxID=129364 RepID=A0A6A4EXG4_9STRA|nr:Fanconi anemia group M protein [Phytophthora rubi]KAE9334680.1 Fanconi anemia group M protein [Phytophthora rubi]